MSKLFHKEQFQILKLQLRTILQGRNTENKSYMELEIYRNNIHTYSRNQET